MAQVTVTIDKNEVHQPLRLSINARDQVTWEAKDSAYTVQFAGGKSPFASPTFEVPAGQSMSSGPITGGTGKYTYTAKPHHSAAGADPDVEILP